MKVLFNTYFSAFQSPGGGEVVMLKLKKALEERGHDVTLFDRFQHKINEFDIIHEFSLIEWRPWAYYQINAIPFVLTPTAWPRVGFIDILKYRLKHYVTCLLYKKSQLERIQDYLLYPRVILPTTSLERERIKKRYHTTRNHSFSVVPNGVDFPCDESQLSREVDERYCLFVGTIAPNKNLLKAIEVCRALGISLVVVGDHKKENEAYYNRCREVSDSSVHWMGRIADQERLASLYYHAECTLVLSDFETCSLVAMESGSYATSVLITDKGGTKEVFKNYVTFCDVNNPQDIKDKLDKILAQNSKDLSLRDFILAHYSWDKIAEQVEKVYEKVLRDS